MLYFRGVIGPNPIAWAKKHVKPLLVEAFATQPHSGHVSFPEVGTPLPPLLGGPRYDLREMSEGYYQLAERSFFAVDPEDALAIRGFQL